VTDQRDDKAFKDFLAGESGLADQYKELGREEPPPETDAFILAEARKAAKVHQLEFGPRGGWLKPVALAATVLLSLSLVMNIVLDMPVRFEQVVPGSAEPSAPRYSEQPEIKARVQREMLKSEEQQLSAELAEIAVTARRKSSAPQDAPQAVSALRSAVSIVDRDGALSVVGQYVAATRTGRVEADETERRLMLDEEKALLTMPDSGADETFALPANKRMPEDDLETDPESILLEIERLNAGGAPEEAARLLEEFLMTYPDHPVSVKIRQQDY
jgi:hypothetical protein